MSVLHIAYDSSLTPLSVRCHFRASVITLDAIFGNGKHAASSGGRVIHHASRLADLVVAGGFIRQLGELSGRVLES